MSSTWQILPVRPLKQFDNAIPIGQSRSWSKVLRRDRVGQYNFAHTKINYRHSSLENCAVGIGEMELMRCPHEPQSLLSIGLSTERFGQTR